MLQQGCLSDRDAVHDSETHSNVQLQFQQTKFIMRKSCFSHVFNLDIPASPAPAAYIIPNLSSSRSSWKSNTSQPPVQHLHLQALNRKPILNRLPQHLCNPRPRLRQHPSQDRHLTARRARVLPARNQHCRVEASAVRRAAGLNILFRRPLHHAGRQRAA